MIKRSGFTLAEVLITLVIIGVIAAMTIPTLMNNTNSQEYRTALKKAISMLNQAITMQYALDGTQVNDYFDAGAPEDLTNGLFVKRLNVINTSPDGTTFYTADGMKFTIVTSTEATHNCDAEGLSSCFGVDIDVNGDKKPNAPTAHATQPKDQYEALIYSQRVVPYGTATQGVMFDSTTVD